jgi:DNA-binding transcriptional LysR family regulator
MVSFTLRSLFSLIKSIYYALAGLINPDHSMDTAQQFRNLLAVIEKGSLGRAAEALRISQPAMTKSIRRLEQQLGVPLFYRAARGMQPTIYGATLGAHAKGNCGASSRLRGDNSGRRRANHDQ